MSKRKQILTALCTELAAKLNGTTYISNLYNNAIPKLMFWDQVNNFPSIYSSTGTEVREYLPGGFKWGYIAITLKLYCKGPNSQDELEQLLEDAESCLDATNGVVVYDTTNNLRTTEILVSSITTDEGLLDPYAVGEINLQVRYDLP